MCCSRRFPLTGTVHADEFPVGECEEGKTGRTFESKKRLVVAALEILEKGGLGRAYAKITERVYVK